VDAEWWESMTADGSNVHSYGLSQRAEYMQKNMEHPQQCFENNKMVSSQSVISYWRQKASKETGENRAGQTLLARKSGSISAQTWSA